MSRTCENCARFDPKDYEDADSWCINENDIRAELEDYTTDHCTEWVSMKHRPIMALREGISALDFLLQNDWVCKMPIEVVNDRIAQIIKMLERGLRK